MCGFLRGSNGGRGGLLLSARIACQLTAPGVCIRAACMRCCIQQPMRALVCNKFNNRTSAHHAPRAAAACPSAPCRAPAASTSGPATPAPTASPPRRRTRRQSAAEAAPPCLACWAWRCTSSAPASRPTPTPGVHVGKCMLTPTHGALSGMRSLFEAWAAQAAMLRSSLRPQRPCSSSAPPCVVPSPLQRNGVRRPHAGMAAGMGGAVGPGQRLWRQRHPAARRGGQGGGWRGCNCLLRTCVQSRPRMPVWSILASGSRMRTECCRPHRMLYCVVSLGKALTCWGAATTPAAGVRQQHQLWHRPRQACAVTLSARAAMLTWLASGWPVRRGPWLQT